MNAPVLIDVYPEEEIECLVPELEIVHVSAGPGANPSLWISLSMPATAILLSPVDSRSTTVSF